MHGAIGKARADPSRGKPPGKSPSSCAGHFHAAVTAPIGTSFGGAFPAVTIPHGALSTGVIPTPATPLLPTPPMQPLSLPPPLISMPHFYWPSNKYCHLPAPNTMRPLPRYPTDTCRRPAGVVSALFDASRRLLVPALRAAPLAAPLAPVAGLPSPIDTLHALFNTYPHLPATTPHAGPPTGAYRRPPGPVTPFTPFSTPPATCWP